VGDFDLAPLMRTSVRRYRPFRLVLMILCIAFLASMAWLTVGVIQAAPSHGWILAITTLGGGTLGAVLSVMVISTLMRLFAPQPTSLRTDATGVCFTFRRGGEYRQNWESLAGPMYVVDRTDRKSIPLERTFALQLTTKADLARPWRRLLPLTYLTQGAFEGIIASAREAGLPIEETVRATGRVYEISPSTIRH